MSHNLISRTARQELSRRLFEQRIGSIMADSTTSSEDHNQGTFYALPAELLLNVLDRLDILDFPSLICATYPLLRHHSIAPPMLPQELAEMMAAASSGSLRRRPRSWPLGQTSGVGRLPPELRASVDRYLTTLDKVSFAIATWRLFNV